MSGYTQKTLDPGRGLGTDADFLQKPFEPDLLLRKVRKMLDALGKQGGGAAPGVSSST